MRFHLCHPVDIIILQKSHEYQLASHICCYIKLNFSPEEERSILNLDKEHVATSCLNY